MVDRGDGLPRREALGVAPGIFSRQRLEALDTHVTTFLRTLVMDVAEVEVVVVGFPPIGAAAAGHCHCHVCWL